MTVSAVDGSSSLQTTTLANTDTVMGKDDFLNLLVAQLQAQDPLNPMDSTDFTAQLAQFSSLEQMQNVNSNLEKLMTYESSQNNALAAGFIDKTVIASGKSFAVSGGTPQEMHFDLEKDASSVYISVYDQSGDLVAGFEAGAMEAGYQEYQWSGTNDKGSMVEDGTYSFEIMAMGGSDESINSYTYTQGRITGVTYYNNAAYLMAGEIAIPLENVVEITSTEDKG